MDIERLLEETRAAERYAGQASCEGNLYTRLEKGEVRYYIRYDGESNGHYLNKGKDAVRALEKKAYCRELLRVARKEEAVLEKIKELLSTMPDYRTVFLNIPAEKRHLIRPYEYAPETEEPIRLFNKKPVSDDMKLITQNGEHVRSKSELIIADRLRAKGLSYYYEDPLIMPERKDSYTECLYWHPDFRVLSKTGKQYYWEHFGLLDDQEYCASCQSKLEIYAKHGFYPGENLIITSESSRHSLNLEYVDCLISKYLL